MVAKVLHVTNREQSVQKRVKEGMKGRSFGPACDPSPLVTEGVLCDMHHYRHLLCSMKLWAYMSTTNKSTSWLWIMSL